MRRGPSVVTALAVALLLGGAAPAAAHDEIGDLEIVDVVQQPLGGGSSAVDVTVEARLTYRNDGHPAANTATVTIIAESADSTASVGPVIAAPASEDGTFTATLSLPAPGAWTLRVSSLAPLATLDHPVDIAAPPEEPTATPAREPTAEPGPADSPTSSASAEPDAGQDAGAPWLLLGGGLAAATVLIAAAAGMSTAARRRR